MSNNNLSIRCSGWLSTLLTVLFVGLKLTNCIDWSWWWVFSPLWIPLAIVILGLLFFLILYLVFD